MKDEISSISKKHVLSQNMQKNKIEKCSIEMLNNERKLQREVRKNLEEKHTAGKSFLNKLWAIYPTHTLTNLIENYENYYGIIYEIIMELFMKLLCFQVSVCRIIHNK